MGFTEVKGEISPPISPEEISEGEEEASQADEIRKVQKGAVPLHPAVIRLPVGVLGRVLRELTTYPGFEFTDQELNDLAELWMECGVEMNPVAQATTGTMAMMAGKVGGYVAWKRQGSPAKVEERADK